MSVNIKEKSYVFSKFLVFLKKRKQNKKQKATAAGHFTFPSSAWASSASLNCLLISPGRENDIHRVKSNPSIDSALICTVIYMKLSSQLELREKQSCGLFTRVFPCFPPAVFWFTNSNLMCNQCRKSSHAMFSINGFLPHYLKKKSLYLLVFPLHVYFPSPDLSTGLFLPSVCFLFS